MYTLSCLRIEILKNMKSSFFKKCIDYIKYESYVSYGHEANVLMRFGRYYQVYMNHKALTSQSPFKLYLQAGVVIRSAMVPTPVLLWVHQETTTTF